MIKHCLNFTPCYSLIFPKIRFLGLSLLLQLMQNWWPKILLCVAVATIIGHTIIPHHHHAIDDHHRVHDDSQELPSNHHDHEQDKEDHHNMFSFAQLDKDFVPVKVQQVNVDLPILYILTPITSYHLNQINIQAKTYFRYYREFPPPVKYTSQLYSRPPPIF